MGALNVGDVVVTNQRTVRQVHRVDDEVLSLEEIEHLNHYLTEADLARQHVYTWTDEHGEEWLSTDVVEIRTKQIALFPTEATDAA